MMTQFSLRNAMIAENKLKAQIAEMKLGTHYGDVAQLSLIALFVIALACSATSATARRADDVPLFLQGQWQVVSNTIDANRTTGAFRENDPDVIGHRMKITGDAMPRL
jgi:hypothetical protein